MTKRPFDQILSIEDLKTTADRLNNYFFTPGAMKFFSSRIDWKLYNVDNERGYFVTSEVYGDQPRHYAVRQYEVIHDEDRDILVIDTVENTNKFYSLDGARETAEKFQGYALIDPKAF